MRSKKRKLKQICDRESVAFCEKMSQRSLSPLKKGRATGKPRFHSLLNKMRARLSLRRHQQQQSGRIAYATMAQRVRSWPSVPSLQIALNALTEEVDDLATDVAVVTARPTFGLRAGCCSRCAKHVFRSDAACQKRKSGDDCSLNRIRLWEKSLRSKQNSRRASGPVDLDEYLEHWQNTGGSLDYDSFSLPSMFHPYTWQRFGSSMSLLVDDVASGDPVPSSQGIQDNIKDWGQKQQPPINPVVTATGDTIEQLSPLGGYNHAEALGGYPNRALKLYYQAAKMDPSAKHERVILPACFYCPITQEVMSDPVILPDGHSFERKPIEDWVRQHGTSPITRTTVLVSDIRENRALHQLIIEASSPSHCVDSPYLENGPRLLFATGCN